MISLNFDEIPVLYLEDDPLTDDVNEINEVNYFETPRIRVPLEKEFFQRAIVNKAVSYTHLTLPTKRIV